MSNIDELSKLTNETKETYRRLLDINDGGGGTSDYNDLDNKPSINNTTLSGNKTASDLGLATPSDIPDVSGFYTKPNSGIPKSDLANDIKTSLGKADTALQSFTETDPTVPSWAKAVNKPSYTAQEVGALPVSTPIPSIDDTLTTQGMAADAKAVGDAIISLDETMVKSVNNQTPDNNGNVDVAVDQTLVNNWLNNHPEATTTVVDGSITMNKLHSDVRADLNNALNALFTNEAKIALLVCLSKVAYSDENGQRYYNALQNALFPSSVTNISCVYTQSGVVYDTDSLDSLRVNLVVTAFYSDGTSGVINNYLLTGTLVAGTSEVTVSYLDKTTTFNITVTATPFYVKAICARGWTEPSDNRVYVLNLSDPTATSANYIAYISIKPNTTYRIHKNISDCFRIDTLAVEPIVPEVGESGLVYPINYTVADHGNTEIVVTTNVNALYLIVHYYNGSTLYDEQTIFESITVAEV